MVGPARAEPAIAIPTIEKMCLMVLLQSDVSVALQDRRSTKQKHGDKKVFQKLKEMGEA
jgi:hypothetical protein